MADITLGSSELRNIKALEEQYAAAQRLEFIITSKERTQILRQKMQSAATATTFYMGEKKIRALLDEINDTIEGYIRTAGKAGKLYALEEIEKFIDKSERWGATKSQLRVINKLNEKESTERLAVALTRVEKEFEGLKYDVDIFKKNGALAGYTEKELVKQLTEAARDEVNFIPRFESRVERITAEAARREQFDAKMGEYRKVAAPGDDWQWITISVKPCPDCQARAGSVLPLTEWEKVGLPRQGRTICQYACLCELVPMVIAEKEFPTVKEFVWDPEKTVLSTKAELKTINKGRD